MSEQTVSTDKTKATWIKSRGNQTILFYVFVFLILLTDLLVFIYQNHDSSDKTPGAFIAMIVFNVMILGAFLYAGFALIRCFNYSPGFHKIPVKIILGLVAVFCGLSAYVSYWGYAPTELDEPGKRWSLLIFNTLAAIGAILMLVRWSCNSDKDDKEKTTPENKDTISPEVPEVPEVKSDPSSLEFMLEAQQLKDQANALTLRATTQALKEKRQLEDKAATEALKEAAKKKLK